MYINKQIKFNIYFQSSDQYILTNYFFKIINFFKLKNISYKIIMLPKQKKYYSILRSPHVYKKSIETFEENIYTYNIQLISYSYKNYLSIFYFLKFLKNNIPLIINLTFKLQTNVKTTLL